MDFSPTEQQELIRSSVRAFAEKELLPHYKHWDRSGEWLTQDYMKKIVDMGLLRLRLPEKFGGQGYSFVDCGIVCEEIGRADHQIRYIISNAIHLGEMAHAMHPDLQHEWIPRISHGEMMSLAFTEARGAADAGNIVTKAVRDGDHWVLNGRKIWISRAAKADFTIVMAATDREKGARGGISAFIVDKGTPGFNVLRRIPMLGGHFTYEIALEDLRLPHTAMLGEEGKGFAPMQERLSIRRVQMAAWCTGRAQRALDMMVEYAPQRATFGQRLADRQAIQWWIADALTRLHACRLMVHEAAARVDRGDEARTQVSMVKVFATEMAWEVIDNVMQAFGAMGMTKELPLQQMANEARLMRIYEGPTEVHRWLVARNHLANYR